MMIILSILIYLFFSLYICLSLFGRFDLARYLQIFSLITFSFNILVCLILNLFKNIDAPGLFLLVQILLCLLVYLWIWKKRAVSLKMLADHMKPIPSGFKWFDGVLLACITLILAAFFVVGITTPPNNLDSLDPTHLTKVFFWLQDDWINLLGNGLTTLIFDPLGVHFQGVWLYSLGRSENLFFLVQWLSLVVTAATIYRISRLLKFSITNALISSLVGLALPVGILQTYSFQGDLTVASFILMSISFGISYLVGKDKLNIAAAIVAFMLALATKRAGFLAIPVFGLFFVFWLISRIRNKKIVAWLTGLFILVLLAGGLVVGNALFRHGGELGGFDLMADQTTTLDTLGEKVKYNAPRYLFQFFGLDGLPRVTMNSLTQMKADLFKGIFDPINIDLEKEVYLQPGYDEPEKFNYSATILVSEESSWFGPFGFTLIPLALILNFFSKEKARRWYAFFTLVLFLSFFALVIIQRPGWDPYQGRYFLVAVLPLVPMISMLFPTQRTFRLILMILIIPISLFLSFNTFAANNSKPVVTAGTLWSYQYQHILTLPENNKVERFFKSKLTSFSDEIFSSTLDRPTIYKSPYWEQVYYSSFDRLVDIRFIDPLVPQGETIYINATFSALDFGLFGEKKDRHVFHVQDVSEVESGYYITTLPSTIVPDERFQLLGENTSYQVFHITPPEQ